MNLNTSYVKVQQCHSQSRLIISFDLNTSYVKVQLLYPHSYITTSVYLNTSYVKVQPAENTKNMSHIAFKYILC